MGVTEVLWVIILLKDIGMQVDGVMRLYCDNKATINLSNNPVMHDRTKHVEIDRHFIREKIDSKELTLPSRRKAKLLTSLPKGCFRMTLKKIYAS